MTSKKFIGKEQGKKYPVTSLLTVNDPILRKLTDAGLINPGSFVLFSSENCISLTTRIKQNGRFFIDRIVVNNLNEGQFACNINDLYTLNQDENVNQLSIKASKISGLMNLLIVEN